MNPKRQLPPVPGFYDFPEDGFVNGAEYRAEEVLLESLMQFGRSLLAQSLDDPDNVFCPGFSAAAREGGERIANNLWRDLMDWLLFDHALAGDGRTVADLFWNRRKL
jgi:hypothetical protein